MIRDPRKFFLTALATIILLAGFQASMAAEEPDLFPFVISYNLPDNITNLSGWLKAPAGCDGYIRNKDGQLVNDAGRVRFWGTNVVANACVPEGNEAGRLADRLARFAINCVRIHHLDNYAIWQGSPNKLTINPAQLDKLDKLIYELKRRGIYTNLNLHVSRKLGPAEGFPNPDLRPEFDKGVCMFDRRMIELQKKYARDLLTHVNPYTKLSYVNEPAIAFVEISNENSIYAVDHRNLGEPYVSDLRKLWNRWLRERYGSTEELIKAWGQGSSMELGEEMLTNGGFLQETKGWRIDNVEQCQLETKVLENRPTASGRSFQVLVIKPAAESWAPVIVVPNLELKKGQTYTVTFKIRTESENKTCHVVCQQDKAPWTFFSARKLKVGTNWKEVRFSFQAKQDEPKARLTFNSFEKGVRYEIADVSFRPGGVPGLLPGQRIENDTVELAEWTNIVDQAEKVTRDFAEFLRKVESDYWNEMYRFLKNDLQVRSLVCGSQLDFSSFFAQAPMDYIDAHAYWQHPQFPGRPWDPKQWYTINRAMVTSPDENTLLGLAPKKIVNKPFTVTEYNHPAPNSYAAEGFPMFASFAAFQNWDGIYSYSYSHSRNFEPGHIENYFDIKARTDVLAHYPACAAMFLRGDVSKAKQLVLFPYYSKDGEIEQIARYKSVWFLTAEGPKKYLKISLRHGIAVKLPENNKDENAPLMQEVTSGDRLVSDTGEIIWDVSQKGREYYLVSTPKTKIFTGFRQSQPVQLGEVTLETGHTRLGWATVSMTVLKGESFKKGPANILVAATGLIQNRDAVLEPYPDIKHAVTLRDKWGTDPVLCEGVPATLTLPVNFERIKCYALDESGNRRLEVPVVKSGEKTVVRLQPEYKTLWYEIEIQP